MCYSAIFITSNPTETCHPIPGRILLVGILVSLFTAANMTRAHEHSAHKHERTRRVALAKATALAEDPAEVNQEVAGCQMTIQLLDSETKQPLSGLVRITNLVSGKAIQLSGEIHRELNWYAVSAQTTVNVPQTKLKIEAFHALNRNYMCTKRMLPIDRGRLSSWYFSAFTIRGLRGLSAAIPICTS